MAEVLIDRVSKTYPNGYHAVDNVSLRIDDGEFLVLVGPSGCGKSTTLRMVAGLEEISSGSISIAGRVVNDVHPKDRDIAMVFQNYALYPHMTVYKNMAFALKLRGVPRAEIDRRVRDAARTLGIEELLDRRPKQLSGGQRQRVAVGRAIVREPKAFLFDEPLSNLDAKLRVTTRAELKALHLRLKTTTIYVTHDQEEAMTLGDRIVVMSEGKIQQAGPPLEVYSRPANRFVASFVGMPPMNFIDGTLERDARGLHFVESPPSPSSLRLTLTPRHADRLASRSISGPVTLGLRPQTFREPGPGADAGASSQTWRLPVRVVEPLGDAIDLFCTSPSAPASGPAATTTRPILARIPARPGIAPGDTVALAVNAEAAHLFAPGEFGENLTI